MGQIIVRPIIIIIKNTHDYSDAVRNKTLQGQFTLSFVKQFTLSTMQEVH